MITEHLARNLLALALAEARTGFDEGGVPIGAVICRPDGTVLGAGHNRWHQEADIVAHGETDAVRRAGRSAAEPGLVLATTMTPCWMCAGMVRMLGIATVVIGDSESWRDGALEWMQAQDVEVVELHDDECRSLFDRWRQANSQEWDSIAEVARSETPKLD